MLHIQSLRDGLPIFRALSSDLRVSIMELLCQEGPLRMSAIAERLGITSGALTPHIKALTDCGLISIDIAGGRHGVQKICCASEESIMIEAGQHPRDPNVYETEIGVGQYTACEVYPTCGICTPERIIGQVDDPRCFFSQERLNSEILWFGHGFVEYMIPNFLQPDQQPIELQLSFEISSEAPGCSEDWPSDVHFRLNGVDLGYWTSPADFGRTQGIYNPPWWFRNWNQHGLYKLLSINDTGSYIDGLRISDAKLSDLNILPGAAMAFRMYVPETACNVGGLTIFGHSFGNFAQDIRIRMHYRHWEGRD